MSLNYRLVRRPDMRKDAAEGSKLYYAQVRSLKKLKFEKFCNMVAVRSSAFVGDVKLVIDGILSVMEESSTSPATSNAIRGAEQSGNIAKQRFAREGWLEA